MTYWVTVPELALPPGSVLVRTVGDMYSLLESLTQPLLVTVPRTWVPEVFVPVTR